MERNVQKNALVNLAAATVIFIAALVVSAYAGSLAAQGATIFLGLGVLVTFASWFQMRLEENERLEKLEVEEMARARGESALFESKEAELFPAQRARVQFEKFFVPGFCVLLFALEAGGAYWLWRWTGRATAGIVAARAMASLSFFALFALVLFLLGRFSVTIARLENRRLLRPGANYLLSNAYFCFVAACGIVAFEAGGSRVDFYIARVFCVLLGLLAAELLVTLLLEIYRPRVKGQVARPTYDSRLVGLLAQPESLFTAAAQALDYQFGFKVSETWFFQLLQRSLPVLFLAQLAALFLSTCFVFVEPGEQAILEHFGRLDSARPVLNPGPHVKWPWPVDETYLYRTRQIQTFDVGFMPTARSRQEKTILWSVIHTKEVNFLVGNLPPATITNQLSAAAAGGMNIPPVGLIDVSIPVQFQITNVLDWAYQNADQTNLLQNLATREVVRYLAGADLNSVLAHQRLQMARVLRERIQNDADAHRLGVKILFVGVQDIHPPVKSQVAATYEKVVSADQERIATNNFANADAIRTNALADAAAFTAVANAQAASNQIESAEFARADLFTNQVIAFDAAPSVYRQRAYFQMFATATANARKYVLLATNARDVVVFNLEDTIREDLLNLNVTNSP